MRTTMIAAAVAVVLLPGCTVKHTEVRQSETPPPVVYQAPAPAVVYQQPTASQPATIAYTVMGQSQFNQAAAQAANWCGKNRGTGARLIDRQHSTAGDIVTFACAS